METKDLDIVYCLRDGLENEELRYSLRSLKNMPHRKVWIYGGCPNWIKNVEEVKLEQTQGNKWLNTSFLLGQICKNDEITEDFVWFNDDFFVMKPIEKLDYFYDRTLKARMQDFVKKSPLRPLNRYCWRLDSADRTLKMRNKPRFNFELHIPMIFNRRKLGEIFEVWEKVGAKRSLYGNVFVGEATPRNDVKIYTLDEVPPEDIDFVSTSNLSFSQGEVGKYLKDKFKRRCKYEKEVKNGWQTK